MPWMKSKQPLNLPSEWPQGISCGLLHIPPKTMGNLYIAMTLSDVFFQVGSRFQMVFEFFLIG